MNEKAGARGGAPAGSNKPLDLSYYLAVQRLISSS